MRLTELNPAWCGAGGKGITDKDGNQVPARSGVGLLYDCPCGCGDRRYVPFRNPLDGGPQHADAARAAWQRTGEDFETLTLAPSIKHVPVDHEDCAWHGFIRNGEIIHA